MAPQRKTAQQQQQQQRQQAADSSAAGPAARTRGAVQRQQQQHQHAAEMVLPLLLQHNSVRTRLRLVCRLLCCSKALAAAVAEHCAGQLDIPEQPDAVLLHSAGWLHKHARLVRSLDLPVGRQGNVPAALARFAAGPQVLELRSYRAHLSSSSALSLLEQLPAYSLTHLDLRIEEGPQDGPASVARLSAGLGRLTGLRALALHTPAYSSWELPGLSGLTQLTALSHLRDLQHIPPQLLELELQRWQQQPLELARLTALTALKCTDVWEGDVLPANLLHLHVSFQCRSVQPLLALQRLQQLELQLDAVADITADQLQQLSRLSALRLDYGLGSIEPASAAAWPLLPLQRLELRSVHPSAAVCQSLAQLSSLTSLQQRRFELPHADSAQQLAAALRRLSRLQQLQLASPNFKFVDLTSAPCFPEGIPLLVQAVGSLQQLRDLDISGFSQLAAAAPALTGLTALSLAVCSLWRTEMASLLSQLPPRLQSLDLSSNLALCDDVLPGVSRLTQLTALSLYDSPLLCNTHVTDAGLLHLTGLVRLKKLNLGGTSVTDAGMHHLASLVQLQELFVPGCVSVQLQRWLWQQLPELHKLHQQGPEWLAASNPPGGVPVPV